MTLPSSVFRAKKQGKFLEKLWNFRSFSMSCGQRSSTRRLSKIAAHCSIDNSYSCSRLPSRSLCSNPTSKKQSSSPLPNAEFHNKEKREPRILDNKPNGSWSKETLKVYHQLQKLVTDSNGLWETVKVADLQSYGQFRAFYSAIDKNGKSLFELYRILNKTEQHYKAVCQFGPWTMGPPGYVHGGAIAAVLDMITAGITVRLGYPTVTANLSVDFKNPIPVGSTVLVDAKVKSIQGKKLYVDGEMKSSDGLRLFATAKTLCIVVNFLQVK